jgi:hypothetical protein
LGGDAWHLKQRELYSGLPGGGRPEYPEEGKTGWMEQEEFGDARGAQRDQYRRYTAGDKAARERDKKRPR